MTRVTSQDPFGCFRQTAMTFPVSLSGAFAPAGIIVISYVPRGYARFPSPPISTTLCLNAVYQGRKIDDWRDEEPGKMIHQARWGPLSLLDIDPFTRYYGD